MKYLAIYWSLFRKETELAVGKFGLKTAVISSVGFLMDSVIGILVSAAFMQLSFFSFLIRLIGGVRAKPEYEQLIVDNIDENFDFKQSIDVRIEDVQKLRKEGRYTIRVPRHSGFTSINHKDEQRLLWLKQRSNLEIVYEYKTPIDPTQTIVFIRVDIKHLFSFLRDCAPFKQENSLNIIQIFDYYD